MVHGGQGGVRFFGLEFGIGIVGALSGLDFLASWLHVSCRSRCPIHPRRLLAIALWLIFARWPLTIVMSLSVGRSSR